MSEMNEGQLQRFESVPEQMRFITDSPRALEELRDFLVQVGAMREWYVWRCTPPQISSAAQEFIAEQQGRIDYLRARLEAYERTEEL